VAESINFSHKNVVVQEMMIIHPFSLKFSYIYSVMPVVSFSTIKNYSLKGSDFLEKGFLPSLI
jgi:hypothetical protein